MTMRSSHTQGPGATLRQPATKRSWTTSYKSLWLRPAPRPSLSITHRQERILISVLQHLADKLLGIFNLHIPHFIPIFHWDQPWLNESLVGSDLEWFISLVDLRQQ